MKLPDQEFEKLPEDRRAILHGINADLFIPITNSGSSRWIEELGCKAGDISGSFGHFFYGLLELARSRPQYVIILNWKGKRICYYSKSQIYNDVIPNGHIIEIENPELISDLFEFFQRLKQENPSYNDKLSYFEIAKKFLQDLSIDATPITHIRKILNHLLLDSFNSIDEKWGRVGGVQVRRDTTETDMEGVFELNFAFGENDTPDFSDQLPTVRYGFSHAEDAVIYAVQTPKYKNKYSKATAESLLTRKVYVTRLIDHLAKWNVCRHDEFERLFGNDFDEHSFKENFEVFKCWMDKIGRAGNGDKLDAVYSVNPNEAHNYSVAIMNYDEYCKAEDAVRKFSEMDSKMAVAKTFFDNGVPSKLRGAPPAMLVSLCTTIHLFHSTGVRKIDIPMAMIFRDHPGSLGAEIDKRKFDQINKLAQRLAFEVEGLKIVQGVEKYPPQGNTTIRIEMEDVINFRSSGIRKLFEIDVE